MWIKLDRGRMVNMVHCKEVCTEYYDRYECIDRYQVCIRMVDDINKIVVSHPLPERLAWNIVSIIENSLVNQRAHFVFDLKYAIETDSKEQERNNKAFSGLSTFEGSGVMGLGPL